MRTEPSAPDMRDLEVAATPVYVYRAAQPTATGGDTTISPHTSGKILVGAWDAGFCSCLNFIVPNCVFAWCCPWISVAQITARLGLLPYAKSLALVLALHVGVWTGIVMGVAHHRRHYQQDSFSPVTLRTGVNAWFFLSVLCFAVYAAAVWQLRTHVRDRFQISGSRAWDLVATGCCTCCAVAQIATHIKSYTPGSCDMGPPVDVLPAYP